jgi:hypothetical protein
MIKVNTRQSLKKHIDGLFVVIATDFDDKTLRRHVKEVITLLTSEEARFTCPSRKSYICLNMTAFRMAYEGEMLFNIRDIGDCLHQDLRGALIRKLLACAIEYFNLCACACQIEKIAIYKRLVGLKKEVVDMYIPDIGWDGTPVNNNLKMLALSALSHAFITAMV